VICKGHGHDKSVCMILMQQLTHIQHRQHQRLNDRDLETVFLEDRYVAFDPGDMG